MDNLFIYYIILTIFIIAIIILLYFILTQKKEPTIEKFDTSPDDNCFRNNKTEDNISFTNNCYVVIKEPSNTLDNSPNVSLNEIIPNAWYIFNRTDNNSNIVYDFSTNNNNMSNVPQSSPLVFGNVPNEYITRIGRKYLALTGSNFITTDTINKVNLNDSSFSICWWSYLNDTKTNLDANGDWIFCKYGTSTSSGEPCLSIGYKNSNKFCFNFIGDDFEIEIQDINTHLNKWIFFTAIYDKITKFRTVYYIIKSGTSDIIYNTSKITSNSLQATADENNAQYQIGAKSTAQPSTTPAISTPRGFFNGSIANFRIYLNRVLTPGQIRTISKNNIMLSPRQSTNVISNFSKVYVPDINIELRKYPENVLELPNNNISVNELPIPNSSNKYYIYNFSDSTYILNIQFSSKNSNEKIPVRLFDGNLNNNKFDSYNLGGEFALNNYENGNFKTTFQLTSNDTLNGDWIKITFKNSFILKTYGFVAIAYLEECAPGSWELRGSNDDINFNLIDYNLSDNNLNYKNYDNNLSYYGSQNLIDNQNSYSIYLFSFPKLARGRFTVQGTILKFAEILMFGI